MYVRGGIPDFLRPVGDHHAEVYRVRVAATLPNRWAEVDCSCGESTRVRWSSRITTYRELVTMAWTKGCGVSLLVGASPP